MGASREGETGRLRTPAVCRLPAIATQSSLSAAGIWPDSVKSVELHQLTKNEHLSPCMCIAAGTFFPVSLSRFIVFWLFHRFLSFVLDFTFEWSCR